tara:strand:+ start:104 stop:271 length:168 start_codon:yes stop_codon:yes gene_type:complete
MDNKDYKETLAKQEDLNWDGNTEPQEPAAAEYTTHVDKDRMEKLRQVLHRLKSNT